MSLTNAEYHRQIEEKGEWRTAHRLIPCSRYFGDLACCARAIRPGQRYFDTKETVPDAGIRQSFKVCGKCANAPRSANFLADRADITVQQCANFPCSELCRQRGCHYLRINVSR